MPLYEFECLSCKNKFEKLQKMTEPDPPCSVCGNEVKRLISVCNHELKGTGWYKTDFRGK